MFFKNSKLAFHTFPFSKIIAALGICLILSSSVFAFNIALGSWQLAKDKEGVKVYTRTSATSSLKDSKATVSIQTNVDAVLDLLRDFDNYPKWMYKCSEGKLLKKVSDKEFYVYSVIDSPWPVSDRDLITQVTASQDGDGTTTLKMKGVASYVAEKSGKVRIPNFDGFWKVSSNGNMVDVVYQFQSDPGGSIPDWMANATSVDIPYNTLLNMKNSLEK